MASLFDFDAHPRAVRRRLHACASTPCTPSPAPMPRRSSRASSARRRARWSTARRCPISAATIPTRTWSTPRSSTTSMMSEAAPDFGAASDGDGDRNLIIGRGIFVTPSDSLALLAANAHLAPGYRGGPQGHRPLDADQRRRRPGRRRSWACPASRRRPAGSSSATCSMPGMATICGEESAGTGSDHVREKDGLWAVLLWLNILAVRRQPVLEIVREHWRDLRPQLLFAPRLRGGRCGRRQRPDGSICATSWRSLPGTRLGAASGRGRRRLRLHRPGRRLGQQQPGHPHPVRGRLAHRLPPVRHRHRRRHPARLPRALRAGPRRP